MVKLFIQDAVFVWYEKYYNVKPLLSKSKPLGRIMRILVYRHQKSQRPAFADSTNILTVKGFGEVSGPL